MIPEVTPAVSLTLPMIEAVLARVRDRAEAVF